MKYFSTFSGVGGFELGIEYDNRSNLRDGAEVLRELLPNTKEREVRATCVGFSEIDKYASAVLRYRFPNTKNYGDISKINWAEVPDFNLLVGGSPCQDLSVAGKRKGITGERSGLFAEFIRALQEKKPEYFIWENVKGALSSNQGWDFAEVQTQMAECGYQLWWQVLNAKDFGVPQNRERIFVIGTRTRSPRQILFERGTDEKDPAELRRVGKLNVYNTDAQAGKIYDPSGISPSVTGQRVNSQGWIKQLNQPRHSNDRVYSDEGISPTLNTMQGGNRQPFVAKETRIRRLTPTECERLMSWPDAWTRYGNFDGEIKEISDTQRYKMCGNGVVSEVVKQVFKHLIK